MHIFFRWLLTGWSVDAGVGAAVEAAEAVAGAVGVGVAGRPAVGARVPRALVLGPGRRDLALQ